MDRRLKVGVFGVGSLGQHHARIYSELAGAELVGLYDVNPQRADEVAKRCGTRAFGSPDELACAIEAASVAVPTDRHFETGMFLLRRGIHVMMEKPIASTTAEAEALVSEARRRNAILQVGHVERFNPVMKFLESHLSRPRFIEAIRIAPYPPQREGAAPRGTEVSVVLDMMIHDLDIILHLVRSPACEIHAVGVPVLSASEDIANVRLVFENGCVANVTASRISRERLRKIRVFQQDTYLSLDYMNQTGLLLRKTTSGIESEPVPVEKGEPLAAELASFVDCALSHKSPVVDGVHGFRALKLAVDILSHIRDNPS